MRHWRTYMAILAAALGLCACTLVRSGRAAEETLSAQVAALVQRLDRGGPSDRNDAERALVDLGLASPGQSEKFLAALPAANDAMSQETVTRLARIRAEVQTRLAERALDQSRVTLDAKDAPLDEVLAQIEKQTGNRVVDYRGEFSDTISEKKVTLKVSDVPFWEALDQLLDATQLSPHPYAAEGTLGLVDRPQGVLSRAGRGASYAGPFRVEALSVVARRGHRAPDDSGLDVELEITWEPRLRPVALAHAGEDVDAQGDDGVEVQASAAGELFNIEVPADYQAADTTLTLQLPARTAKSLARLKGRVAALVPGRIAELRFAELSKAANVSQDAGGVTVTLNRVSRNQSLWEFQMRIRVAAVDSDADPSRGWVFQNTTYLEDKNGERLDHAGFETTMQTQDEIGFAYYFELPEGASIDDYAWVYRTPAGIVSLPVDYELRDIPLP